MDRGQTHIDFVAGLAIFLATVLFVAAFMPSIITPYDDQATVIVADRVANDLAGALLASSGPASALNESCTRAFFETANSSDAGCPFDSGDPRWTQLGIERTFTMNVTLRRNVSGDASLELLCADGDSFVECPGSDGPLAVGPPVPENDRAVAGARRVVLLDEKPTVLVVKVW